MPRSDVEKKVDKLLFGVDKSIRYHQRRRGFYDTLHKIVMFSVIIGGSSVVAFFVSDSDSNLGGYIGSAVAIFATLDLVFNLSHRARDHEMLYRRFGQLSACIQTSEHNPESYTVWLKERIDIEADEPPLYYALEADCDNETRRAWGRDKKLVTIKRWARWTMNLYPHATTPLKLDPNPNYRVLPSAA